MTNETARNTRGAMLVISLSLITVISAVSGLNIALPNLARSTGATQTQLTWIIDAYTIVFASLLFFAGALGDRFGRKPLLIIGLAIFGVGAVGGALVTSPAQIIFIRAFMGVGAAAVMPTTLSVITTSFPPEERPRAIGAWVGIAGAGVIIGLFASGLLLEWFEWNSFFWLNVVLSIVAIAGTMAFIPDSKDENPPFLDVVGAFLALLAVGGIIFGIIEGPERGWTSTVTITGLVLGVIAAIAFIAWENRLAEPMLEPRLFLNRGMSTGTLSLTVSFFAWLGMVFALLQYLQFVAGLSALMTAVALLPVAVVLLPTARLSPRLADRFGFRRVVSAGLVILGIGFAIVAFVSVDLNYPRLAVGLVIASVGMGLSGTPATTIITESLPDAKQGIASAINDTTREFGAALGTAILGSTLNQVYRSTMEPLAAKIPNKEIADYVVGSVSFTEAPELAAFGERGQQLAATAKQAFVDGTHSAMLLAATVAAVAGIIILIFAPRRQARTAATAG